MNNNTVSAFDYYFYGILVPYGLKIELIPLGIRVSWHEFYTPDVYMEVWDSINNEKPILLCTSLLGYDNIEINIDTTLSHSISLRAKKDNAVSGFSQPVSFTGNVIYVSPNGIGSGTTINDPADFQQTLISSSVLAGCTILMLDGTYKGYYVSTITGTASAYITIRPLNYLGAIIDGGLRIGDFTGNGAYTVIRNLEIFYSGLPRGDWSTPEDLYERPNSLYIAAPNCKQINNILHDGGIGLVYYQTALNNIAYGNICYNNGWPDIVGGGCQSTYYHGTGQKVKHNIFAGGFKRTFANYGTNDGTYNHELVENVIIEPRIDGEILSGCENAINTNILIDGNHTLGANFVMGWHKEGNRGLIFQNNRCYRPMYQYYGAVETRYWKDVSLLNNIIVGQAMWYGADDPDNNYTAEGNKYYSVGNVYPIGLEGTTATKTMAQWQALGFDLTGSYESTLPTVNEIFVYPNEYYNISDKRLGLVVIWNWEGLNTVSVDISTLGLVNGTTYRWRQAQDPLTDIGTFVYGGINVNFSMIGHTVALPIGFTEELIPNQFPLFGCFIIESV